MAVIEAVGLRKVYPQGFRGQAKTALEALDLRLEGGAAFGLIGPNGAGKTTFIKLLLAIARPSGGAIRVFGVSPEDSSVRRRIGYLPERLELPAAWTPPEFLASVGRLKRLGDCRRPIDELLERVGLAADRDRRIGVFSKGMRQRLGLAAALLGKPDLLVLDEPSDGIDPIGRMEVRRILLAERQRGVTLLVNSHLLSETERICDRIGILGRGRLLREGTLGELCQDDSRWTARFAPGFDPQSVRASGFSPLDTPDRWALQVAGVAQLNEALDRVRGSGALLIELSPQVKELEDVLADAVGAASGRSA